MSLPFGDHVSALPKITFFIQQTLSFVVNLYTKLKNLPFYRFRSNTNNLVIVHDVLVASGDQYTPYQGIDCLHLNPAGKEIVSVLASWAPMDSGWF